MKKFGSILLIFIFIILLAWLLPWCFTMLNARKGASSFILYSTISDDFIVATSQDGKRVGFDTSGKMYRQNDVDSLLPFFYWRQLQKDERFPDLVKGRPVTLRDTQHESFVWNTKPREVNLPQIGVHQLMESASQRVQLESPGDIFRINKQGIEFIDAETNTIDYEKSKRFTDMMKSKDFAFPANTLSGNPSVKKEYDEGYIIIDNAHQLFHLKQIVGRPYVRKIDLPAGVVPKHVFITEHRNRKSIGYMVDTENRFYVVGLPGYSVTQVEIPAFDPERMSMMIYANPFDWTVKVAGIDFVNYYAVDASTYKLLAQHAEEFESTVSDRVGDFINSIGLRFTSPLDKFVYPRFGY